MTGSGSAGLSGSWRTDTESCQYVLNEASLDLSVGTSGEIPFWKPPVKIPGVTVEVAANISGQAAGTLIWQGGNFPSWPQSGDVELTAQAVPYGKVNFFDIVGADIQGEGRVVGRYTPPSNFEFSSWCAALGAEAKLWLLRYSWSEKWGSCTGFNRLSPLAMVQQADPNNTMAIYQSQNHEGIPIESALIVTIDPLVGTGNVYEGNPVLSTISNDLQHDGKPTIAKSNRGEILAAWTKDSDQPDVAVGSAVVVASYNGNGWDTPVEIQSAEHFNKQTALAFDSNDKPMLLCSNAPANVTLTSPITDVVEATKQTDIFFSYRDSGTWSTPTALASLSGQDESVQVAADETGQVMAAWRHTENDQTHTLYSAIWNGSSWSTPATIPANEIIDS